MNQKEPVPREVYDAAYRVYIRGGTADAADCETVWQWAGVRYPLKHSTTPAECALWALSVTANYGTST